MTISSTLRSIDQSLLNEIRSYHSHSTTSGVTPAATTASDDVGISKAAELFKALQQLQTSNPAEFKQVLTDGAAKLREAAKDESNPANTELLNDLADRFQKAADTGDLDAIQLKGHGSHHHHHHRHYQEDDQDASSSLIAGILTKN